MQTREPRKKKQNLLPTPTCIYCGRPATTRDHVPPKAIFVKLQLPDLVTVPACEDCNNQASRFDEGFRNIIGMRSSEESPNSLTLWKKTFRSLKRRRQELEALWESLREVPIFTGGGLYLGTATEGAFDAEAHDRVIERITRGLYFHHSGQPLPLESPIEVYPIRDGSDWQKDVAPLLTQMRVRTCMGLFLSSRIFGLSPVLCSEQESRSSFRRLRSGSRSGRKGSRDRNGSKAWRPAA